MADEQNENKPNSKYRNAPNKPDENNLAIFRLQPMLKTAFSKNDYISLKALIKSQKLIGILFQICVKIVIL